MEIRIRDRLIGVDYDPFVVAELSGNHNNSLDNALKLIEAAAQAGVDAVKLQTYTAESMTLNISSGNFLIEDPHSLWNGRTLYDLYEEASTPYEWHAELFRKCEDLGILCFSSPFDEQAIEFLEELGCPAYKIASFENQDLALIRRAAKTGKPLIISTGISTLSALEDMVNASRDSGCNQLILLKCTSAYPADPKEANLVTIPHLKQMFGTEVGLSDHTLGIGVAVASVALGASFIEKHFVLDRKLGGVDSAFSMEPDEMAQLVRECKIAKHSLGTVSYRPGSKESKSRQFKRSLIVAEDINKGDLLTVKNIKSLRPGIGLPSRYIEEFIGKRAPKKLKKGTPVSWDILYSGTSEQEN